ncbi:MAG: zinc finger domain-containing protein, partial [Acidimicrobiales bacterium]
GGGLAVYGRRGQPCRRCGTRITSTRSGDQARVVYWCPTCQR